MLRVRYNRVLSTKQDRDSCTTCLKVQGTSQKEEGEDRMEDPDMKHKTHVLT